MISITSIFPFAVVLSCLALLAGAANQQADQGEKNQVFANGSAADLAKFLALNSKSAGVVSVAADTARVAGPTGAQQRSREWLQDRRVSDERLFEPLTETVSTHRALERFAAGRNGRFEARPGGPVPTLVDGRAVACQRVLQRKVKIAVKARTVWDAVAALANTVSPGSAPRGFVSSCNAIGNDIAGLDFTAEGPFQNALSTVAGNLDGIVWFAIDNDQGGCSLGLIQRQAEQRGFCQVLVAEDVR